MKKYIKHNQRIIIPIVVVLLLIAFLVFSTNRYFNRRESIKIGLTTTLSGTASNWGVHARNGAILAIEQINETGGIAGRHLELIIKDDKADVNVGLKVDQELIDSGVVAILGHTLSTLSVAAVPLANENGIVMIDLGSSTVALSGLDDFFIRVTVPLDRSAPLRARLAYDRLTLRKMVVVYDASNPKYTELLYQYFKTEFERLGGKVLLAIPFDPRQKFSAPEIARQISASEVDGVFLITDAVRGALICQHIRKTDTDIIITDSGWAFSDPDFVRVGGRAVNGVVCLSLSIVGSTRPSVLKYKIAYEERFGQKTGAADQLGFEAAQMLSVALRKTQDPKKLKKTLLEQKKFEGLDGDILLDRYGDPIRPMSVLTIEDGKLKRIEMLNLVGTGS